MSTTTNNLILDRLKEPFLESEIEWRPSHHTGFPGKYKILMLAYVTARAVMDRLDDVMGPSNWSDNYDVIKFETYQKDRDNNEICKVEYGTLCTLSVRFPDRTVEKQGFATFTNVEPIKGGESDSLKRAAVKFGIGRYLYKLEDILVSAKEGYDAKKKNYSFYDRKEKKKVWLSYDNPTMPKLFLPKIEEKVIEDPDEKELSVLLDKCVKAEASAFLSDYYKKQISNVFEKIKETNPTPKGAIELIKPVLDESKEYASIIRDTAKELKKNSKVEITLNEAAKTAMESAQTLEEVHKITKDLMDKAEELADTIGGTIEE